MKKDEYCDGTKSQYVLSTEIIAPGSIDQSISISDAVAMLKVFRSTFSSFSFDFFIQFTNTELAANSTADVS